MEFREAWDRVAMAGRELGSGPAAAVVRIVPSIHHVTKQIEVWGMNDDRAGGLLLGLAVGLVMAEDQGAMRILESIEEEWRRNHGA
jgi:hypothetical protein